MDSFNIANDWTRKKITSEEHVDVCDLGNYTIVYPDNYTQLRLDVPTMLADAIEKVLKKRPQIKSNKENVKGKRISLVGGTINNAFSDVIENFEDDLSYIVAVKDGNIILGGKNYYADSNAVYNFVNNILGWDDVEGVYSKPAEKVYGATAFIHSRPTILIQGATWSSPITDIKMVKYLAEANFNGLMFTYCCTTEQSLHDLIRWCARYGVYLVLNRGVVYPELFYDCPIILGHYIWDEPTENDYGTILPLLAEYKEKYAKYGWKSWVNFVGSKDCMGAFDADEWVFGDMDVTGIDAYAFVSYFYGRQCKHFIPYEMIRNAAKLHGLEAWYYIQSYDHADSPVMNTSKAYLWQMQHTMCFAPDSIIYFEYGNMLEENTNWCKGWDTAVIDRDFLTRGKHYYDAKKANMIILEEAEILKNYEQVGVGAINRDPDENYTLLEKFYDFSEIITEIKDYDREAVYFVGCFEEKTVMVKRI